MRYAIVSDLHANIRAWDAVLADLREQKTDVTICLGDVVGYGPKPAEVLDAVREETELFVLGNHDAAAVNMIDYSIFNDHARQAIEWTMTELNEEQKTFLSSVPLAIEAEDVLFVHAEIREPGRFDYIDSLERAEENFKAKKHLVTFVGHTHLPKIFEKTPGGKVVELLDDDKVLEEDHRYIVNVGSVGEPRNPDDLRARYVIYDTETRKVEFRRVEFDIVAYRRDLESTTLSLRPFFLRTYEYVVEGREVTVSQGGSLHDMTVAHNAASLVDLSKVSSVRAITNQGALLKSAQQSKAPTRILAIAALLIAALVLVWAFSPSRDRPDEKSVVKLQKDDGSEEANQKPAQNKEQLAQPDPDALETFSVNIVGTGKAEFWQSSTAKETIILKSTEEAGAPGWEARRWHNVSGKERNTARTTPVSVMGTFGKQITFEIINQRNFATFHWEKTRDDSDSVSIPNAKMLDGHSNGVESEKEEKSENAFPLRTTMMAFSDIPFPTYDVVVYLGSHGYRKGSGKGVIRINEEINASTSTDAVGLNFKIPEAEPDGSFLEVKKSGDEGNFVVYRNLTLPTFVVQSWGEENNRIGIAGIQIRGKGSRDDVTISRSKSSLAASKKSIVADEKDALALQVTARNSLGDPVPGVLIEPTLSSGAPEVRIFPPKCQTNDKGIASFTVVALKPGKLSLSAKGFANGRELAFGKVAIESKKNPEAQTPKPNATSPGVASTNLKPDDVSQIYFRAEEYGPRNEIIDQSKKVSLGLKGAQKAPRLIPGVAPALVPLTRARNDGGLQIQSSYWEDSESRKIFSLERNRSFTCEAFVKIIKAEGTLFLFGTRTAKNNQGWMLYLKGKRGGAEGAEPAFFFQSGDKIHQAIGDKQFLVDKERHHLAVIWDHDASPTEGKMSLIVNGSEIASTMVDLKAIAGAEANPFSIGGKPNKGQVAGLGIDEIRFSREALTPSQLLSYSGPKGARLTGNDAGSKGAWNNPANWEGNELPSGKNNAIISRGNQVTITKANETPYDAQLILEEGSRLHFASIPALNALPSPSNPVVMQKNSQMVFTGGHLKFPNPIKLDGDATIFGSLDGNGNTKNRSLDGVISGKHSLTVVGSDGGRIIMNRANTFSGSFTARIPKGNGVFIAAKDKCLGTGNVTIKDRVSILTAGGRSDVIDDKATLTVEGAGAQIPQGRLGKFQIDGEERVGGFIVKGVDQGEGTFDSKSHPGILTGPGKLIVKKP